MFGVDLTKQGERLKRFAERAGVLGNRFGCATPDEAVAHHELWAAALESQRKQSVETL